MKVAQNEETHLALSNAGWVLSSEMHRCISRFYKIRHCPRFVAQVGIVLYSLGGAMATRHLPFD